MSTASALGVDALDLDVRAVRQRENAEIRGRERRPSWRAPRHDRGENRRGWTRTSTAFDVHVDKAHRDSAHLAASK